ncbi:MAG TPA: ATP-binding protein [Candidatus Saccharimonadales bacterium]|nr:ATP-binding protein [Candidatus Saccharimonadales bacterium]
MLEFLVLLFTAFANLFLGLIVFIKNPKSSTNKLFLLLTTSFIVWSFVNYISVHPVIFSQLTWIRLVLFCGGVLNLSVFLTFLAFPDYSLRLNYKKPVIWATLTSAIIIPLTLTPLVFSGIKVEGDSVQPVPNVGIGLFLLQTIILIGASFFSIIAKYRRAKGAERNQLRLVLLAIIGTFTLIVLANFLLVILFNFTGLVPFGPAFTLIFSTAMAYAIVRHKLFDIKRAVARSVAYLLSLGLMGILYGAVIYAVSLLLSGRGQFDNAERGFYIFLALLSALLFTPIKKFFDRFTNRIFYRDAYDPQQFLNDLNSTVVENIELGILLRHTTQVIQQNIKSDFCYVKIKATPTAGERLIGNGRLELSEEDSRIMKEELIKTGTKTVITDELGSDFKLLKEVLFRNNIGMLIRMMPGSDMSKEAMYYLILGDKKSGNVYDKQDVRIMEIIGDELLIAIQNSIRFEEIQQFNVTLQQKVNDATAKLQRTNKKLRELDETKDEFISMASHQLRTPLTSAKGYMSMVIEGDAGKLNKQQTSLLNQAFVSSQRMVYLIADLLNVSRLKTGKFVIDAHPTDLSEITRGEMDQLTETAKLKKIELKYDRPKNLTKLMLDETKVRQVIMNFIDNAVYYTPSGGQIKVEVKEDEGHVYFTVRDNGLGVPKEDQKHLFTKFFRATNARNARPDGTGLGLFMAKKVVDAQGGTILFESTEGKGSLFGFSFDKKKLAVPDNIET